MNPYIKIILKEMCKRAGVDYDNMDFQDPDWFMEYAWTQEEEATFKTWIVDYLYNNTEARKSILMWPKKTKKHLRGAASEFIFQYGWKYKE